jgi:hypothetical protein
MKWIAESFGSDGGIVASGKDSLKNSEQLIGHARSILEFCRSQMAS